MEQNIYLRARDGAVYSDKRVLEEKRYDGLGAGQATGGMNRFLELSLANIRQKPRPFDDGKPLNSDYLYLAERLQPTSKGNTVKLWYTLTVFCNYGTCCAEEPHCTIPLCITPPPLPSFGKVEAPPGWSPVVYNTFNFNLPGPGEVLAAAQATAQATVAPVSGNVQINVGGNVHEEAKMEVNMNVPPVPVPSVQLEIDTDKINAEVPIPAPVPMPAMNVEVTGNAQAQPENVSVEMNMGGMPVRAFS